ncbi:hypothetical protein [Thioflexithrix psekupsensis]|uniref:Chemotaxis protein CheC n=1 Tax=Thioflexithrix psekupsensis TaxID=1570016 RepID=A0A251X7Q4_9GAMM|nr:hypothetical protein [Thioflexithrix psekupsensis]OUD13970.1 hypothetical protein TPSD3_06395 [Thioflexithrix psekupsensis]
MDEDTLFLSELQKDAICEMLNIGMGQAAASLSAIISEELKLSIPTVELLSRQEAANIISCDPQRRIAGVKQHFEGPFWGDALLLFPQEKSLQLVRALVKEELPPELLAELEQDALTEVGNIILNSCLGSFGNVLTQEVTSDLPLFINGSALEVLYTAKPQERDVVMFMRVEFSTHNQSISGYVAFLLEIPSIAQFKVNIDKYLGQI